MSENVLLINIYIELHALCLSILFFLTIATARHNSRRNFKTNNKIIVIYALYAISVISKCLLFVLPYFRIDSFFIKTLLVELYYGSIIFASGTWFLFAASEGFAELLKKDIAFSIILISCSILLGLIITSPITKIFFSYAEDGTLIHGKYILILTFSYYFYPILSTILCLIKVIKNDSHINKMKNFCLSLYVFPIIIFGFVEMYTGVPFLCLGIILSLTLVYVTVVRMNTDNILDIQNSLIQDYQSVFVVNVDADKVIPIRIDPGYLKSISDAPIDSSYKKRLLYSVKHNIIQEDQIKVIQDFDAEYIYETLQNQNSYYTTYRILNLEGNIQYQTAKFARMEFKKDRMFLLGIRNSTEEIKDKLKTEENERLKNIVINALSKSYMGIYMINFTTQEIKIITSNNLTRKNISKLQNIDSFQEVLLDFIEKYVHPEDRHLLIKFAMQDEIKAVLAERKYYAVTFRYLREASYKYTEVVFTKAEEIDEETKSIIITLQNVDEEYRKKEELNRLQTDEMVNQITNEWNNVISEISGDFFLLIKENLDTNEYVILRYDKTDGENFTLPENLNTFDERAAFFAKEFIHPEDRKIYLKEITKENILKKLSEDSYFAYRFRIGTRRKFEWYENRFVNHISVNDDSSVIIGFRRIDEEVKQEQARMEMVQNAKNLAIMQNIGGDYEGIYYVKLNESEDDEVTELYKLNEQLNNAIPGFEETKKLAEKLDLLMKHIPDDEDKMLFFEQTRRDVVEEKLEESSAYYVNFILNIQNENHFYLLKFTLEKDDAGENTALIVGIRNIDKEKTVESQLLQANKSKSLFLFNMSHDIRTPMNAIIGYTALAKKHIAQTPKVTEYLDKIDVSGQHLLKLINEVLDMSRIEAGIMHSEVKLKNVVESAEGLVTICKENADEKGVELSFENKGVVNQSVFFDELHVNQIIINILSNAIKYSKRGGKVIYSIEELEGKTPGYACFEYVIQDFGIGITPEFLSHIFDSFAREKNSTVSGIEGTGLGMAIVKRLVDYMDGNIEILSELGAGTKVTVRLQFKMNENGVKAEKKVEEDMSFFKEKKILLVEDNDMNREIAKEILEDEGIIVEEAEDGKIAVENIRKRGIGYYDYVLMDIQMPIMNGYEATEKIRKMRNGKKLPIVALSANAFEEDKQASIQAGMNAHVAKPIKIDELFDTLRSIR